VITAQVVILVPPIIWSSLKSSDCYYIH